MPDVHDYVINLLRKSRTMTISTDGEKLWTTKIFFAMDHGFVFLVEKTGLTFRNISKNPSISFSVDNDRLDLFLQGSGRVEILGEPRDFVRERGILLYKITEDSVFVKHGNVFIARLIPESIIVSDMRTEMKRFLEDIDLDQMFERRRPLLKSVRAWSFQQSLIALIVGSILAMRIDIVFFILSIIGIMASHGSFNILNGYFDTKTGNDTFSYQGGSRVFVDKMVRQRNAITLSVSLFLLALGIGVYLAVEAPRIIPFLAIGIAAGALYSLPKIGLKRYAFGDAAVFLAWAPGIFLGGYVLQGGLVSVPVVLISFSIGLLTVSILHANNWRDMDDDLKVGVRTIANILGSRASEYYYFALLWVPYILVLAAYLMHTSYYPLLAVMLTAPLVWRLSRIASNRRNIKWGMLDRMTASATLYFGLAAILPFVVVYVAMGAFHTFI